DLQSYTNDPATCTWAWRKGVSEGSGGTLIGSGDSKCVTTATGRNAFGFNEFENVTTTTVHVTAGNLWFTVIPDCTNSSDSTCSDGSRSFGTTTDGTINAINGTFSVRDTCDGQFTGPVFDSGFFGATFANWCNDFGIPAGIDPSLPPNGGATMSYGVMK